MLTGGIPVPLNLNYIYYLPMERMKELTVAIQDEYEWKVIYRTKLYTEEEYKKLEQENKKLKWLLKEHVTTYDVHFDELIEENKKLKERIKELEEQRIFSLWEYNYMILTSTTPQLKLIKKDNSDLCSNITVWTTQK